MMKNSDGMHVDNEEETNRIPIIEAEEGKDEGIRAKKESPLVEALLLATITYERSDGIHQCKARTVIRQEQPYAGQQPGPQQPYF